MDQISNVEVSESFEYYLSVLKNHLSYVEDTSFRWSDVNGILIIQLKNTDSLNKNVMQVMPHRFKLQVRVCQYLA